MSNAYEEEVETSDDDFIDPSIEKYFNKKQEFKKNGSKKKHSDDEEEDVSDYEEQEDDEEEEVENEEESDEDEDKIDQEENPEANENDDDDPNDGRKRLDVKTIRNWSNKLAEDKPFKAINQVVKAFKASLLNVVPGKRTEQLEYKVEGSDMFNAMVRLCMKDLLPCFLRLLNLNKSAQNGKKRKSDETKEIDNEKIQLASGGANWKKLKAPIKSYVEDMMTLASKMNEAEILNAILRHIRLMINFYMCFPKVLKQLIKLLITIWSQNDEKSRVIAFVCLHKIAINTHEKNQDLIFKTLYLSFARNSKFTSINTLPLINFMQRSLIEIYSVNTKLAYEHIFVYIRQLAIHLRNAMNLKKKESYQAVYNWQYVHSLVLWSKLLSALVKKNNTLTDEQLQPLVYPLIQCIIGTIKLIPTPRYYPLRFHCINALITLSNASGVFVPVIPFILEVFDITDFNKKHATISPKPVNFSFLLKLNKQQLLDKSFKDVLIDIVYDNLILLLQNQSHHISFPELVLPLMIRLKDFTKKCKSPNYCKVIKGLLDKVQENVKFVEDKRNKAKFSLVDTKAVELWCEQIKDQGTPLSQWYSRYKTLREREILMEISNKDMISKNKVPLIERPTSQQKEEEKKEFSELFVNLSDDDSDTELMNFVPKKKQKKNDDQKMDEDEFDDEEDDFADAVTVNTGKKSENDSDSD